jgi:RecA-family ATPase
MREGARDVVVLPLADKVLTLYRDHGPTAAMQALERLCLRVPGLVQLAIDPAGSFFRGDTNDAAQFGGFALELRSLASRLGISVALTHHTTKQAATTAAVTGEAMSQHAASGSMMLVNSARIGAIVQRMTKKAASDWGIEAKDAHRYVSLSTPKANGVESIEQQWFLNVSGVPVPVGLTHTEPAREREDRDRAKAEKDRAALTHHLHRWGTGECSADAPISKTALASLLATRAGIRVVTAQGFVESEISRRALLVDATLRIKGSSQGGIRLGPAWSTSPNADHGQQGF